MLAPVRASSRFEQQHEQGLANMLAQAEAFARGRNSEEVCADLSASGFSSEDIKRLAPHKVHPGDRPSNILLFRELNPRSLGRMIALYEHKVFVQGVIWGVNSFDQWGVELGKVLAQRIIPELESEAEPALEHDSSTNTLIRRYRDLKGQQ